MNTESAVAPASPPRASGMAVAALVCGIVGLVLCCLVVPSVLGIVFGFVAISQIHRQPQLLKGKGMAIAGIVCGFLGLVLLALVVVLWLFSYGVITTELKQIDAELQGFFEAYSAGDDERCYRMLRQPGVSREEFGRQLQAARERWGRIRARTSNLFEGGMMTMHRQGANLRATVAYRLTTEKGTAYAVFELVKEGGGWQPLSVEITDRPRIRNNPFLDWDD